MTVREFTPAEVNDILTSPMVNLPAPLPGQPGNVLDIISIGIWPEPRTPYVRTTAGATYRLPADLYDFIDSLMSMCLHERPGPQAPVLPARIAFRIQDGHVHAEVLTETKDTP